MPDAAGPEISTTVRPTAEAIQHIIAVARRAYAAADWPEALAKWQEVQSALPGNPVWVSGLGTSLRMLGRFDEADACYMIGLRRFPNDADIAGGFARVAVGRSAWFVAVARWQDALTRFPDYAPAAAGLGAALVASRRLSEAEAVLNAAKARFPDDQAVAAGHAGIAASNHDWPEALTRWRAVLDRYPDNPGAHVGVGMALRELTRFDEADEVLWIASSKFPTYLHVLTNLAWVAMKRRNWPEALRRWEIVRDRFGEIDAYVRSKGYIKSTQQIDALDASLSRAEQTEPQAATTVAPVASDAPVSAMREGGTADLLTKFESLGDDCTFGFVQRYAEAEPMGLLRWANVPTHNLLDLLKTRFEGVGETAFTELYTEADGELWAKDTRHDMRTHTFVFEASLPGARRARFHQLMCSRFRFLREQLIKDLEMASKIFVFKSKDDLSQGEAEAVYGAVRQYGSNWLLCVRPPDADHQPGTVRLLHDHFMIGHVRMTGALDRVGWQQLCVNALALRAGTTRG